VNKPICAIAVICCLLAIPAAAAVKLFLSGKMSGHLRYSTDPARSLSPTLAMDRERKIEPGMCVFVRRATLGKPILIHCYVRCTNSLQTVTIYVPKGLRLMDDERRTKLVGPMGPHGFAVVKWQVWASEQGNFKLIAVGTGLPPATGTVQVRTGIGFDG
jgi:hypothetical protein